MQEPTGDTPRYRTAVLVSLYDIVGGHKENARPLRPRMDGETFQKFKKKKKTQMMLPSYTVCDINILL